jgi:membrane-bound lytic murein transglycosylase A
MRFAPAAPAICLALLVLLAGCTGQKPPPTAEPLLRLTRADFASLPDWRAARLEGALASFQRGCAVLAQKPDATPMGGAGYAGTVADWRAPCAAAQGDARGFFEQNFTPYKVAGEALFTGYYEPEIRGRRTQGGAFQTPVYGLPDDLVRADLGLFNPKLKGEHISGRLDGHRLAPYATRAEIHAKAPPARLLFYTDDPIAFFFLQIQGSGRVVFDDGSSRRIAYAGENGQPYTAIGRTLIAEGALTREQVSLQSIRAWLIAHPDRAQSVMDTNKSYIFFQEKSLGDPALGSSGTLGAALTPLASIAVDARLHALGAPFYLAADGSDPVQGLLIAEDTGGAIRGPARADIFFGFGPDAERRAGLMKAPGKFYLLLPKPLAERLGDSKAFTP